MKNKTETASFESSDMLEQQTDETTRPLGVGAFASEMSALPGEGGKSSFKLRSSSIVLGVVLVLAIVGLFSMHTLAKVTASVVGNEQMERIIDDFMNSSAGQSVFQLSSPTDNKVMQSKEVLAVLNEAYTERQVPLNDVQKDPFLLLETAPRDEPKTATSGDNKANELERQRAQRKEQLTNIAQRLSLKSVMLGAVPLANINGQIVRPGEIITVMPERQEFEVLSIETESVRLSTADLSLGVRIEITIEINREQGSNRKR